MEDNIQSQVIITPEQVAQVITNQSKQSIFLPIIISSLVTAALIIGSYYLFINKNTKSINTSPSPSSLEIISASADPFSDWQIYKNDRYGYSFKFPKGWKITFEDTYQYSNVTISTELEKSINVTHFTGKPEADKQNWTKNFVLDNSNYIMAAFAHCAGGPGTDCDRALENDDITTFNQVLSTFKVYPETANILIFDVIKKLTEPMIWSEEKPGEIADVSGENVKGSLIISKVAAKEDNKFAGLLVTDSPLVTQYGWKEDPSGIASGMGEELYTYTKNDQKLIIRYKGGTYQVLLSK